MSGTINALRSEKSGIINRNNMLKHTVMDVDMSSGAHRSTTSTTFTNSGISGSFVTEQSSAVSFFIVHYYCSMYHLNTSGQNSGVVICCTTASNTTHDSDDDLNHGSYGMYYDQGSVITQNPLNYYGLFKVGASQNVNMSSYSGGTTIYCRMFHRVSAGTLYNPHEAGAYLFEVTEYLK